MSRIALSGDALGTGTFTIASPNSNTDRTLTLPNATGTVIVGAQPTGDVVGTTDTQTLTNKSIVATQLTGTVPAARLGSGTADSTTFLRGDNTWQVISTSPTTAQVLTATADASVGAVGTYAFLGQSTVNLLDNAGGTRAGSSLRYAGIVGNGDFTSNNLTLQGAAGNGGTPAGTWRCMGRSNFATNNSLVGASLYLRIS